LTPGRRGLIANLIGQLAFGLLAMTICLPSMQEWGAIFQADQAAVQLTFSGFVVASGILQLLYGPLSDRHGRRRILIVGLSIALAASVLAALATDIATLTFARVLQGVGGAAGMVVGRAMVQDLFHGPDRTRVMAYVGMTMGLCPPLATLLGGQLHVRFGWQANFVFIAVLAALLIVAAWRGLPRTVVSAEQAQAHWLRAMLSAYARLSREPGFGLHVAILGMTTATFYIFLAGAPIVLGSYGVGPEALGWYVMVVPIAYIVGNFLASRLIHRTGDRAMMFAGQVSTMSGIALMLALGLAGVQTPLAFSLPLLLLGIGHGFLMPPALSGTIGLVPALAGSAAAVAGLTQQTLGAAGGYLVGLMPHDDVVNLGWLMIGSAGLAGLAIARLHWGTQKEKARS
jgi:DHA1 family bicyclomycin/chloramphenicol resistance-like MFS transporter